ncbi:short-chain dehydrogenase/reductase family 42E member 1-like [Anneissia japonica]|uniref:short-chain dehydrogenase/reductase family 42E member 1-like n=1 Tax=Anneissia japonica TaxID=1529436 RepID=UPI0014256310|nr:short-chain dehydrogenase/reductase family 42E member 1-like [Anneissia japonica]
MVSEKIHLSRAGDAIRSLDVSSFENVDVLITGGAGFFGVHLGRALHLIGAHVTLFDINLPIEDFSPEIKLVKGDIRNKQLVDELCRGKSCVFHMASYGMSGPEMLKPTDFIESINVGGTDNVIEACCRHNVPRLVYTSSIAVVFGGKPIEGATEETCPVLPLEEFTDDYSRTKCIAEKNVLAANGRKTEGGHVLHTCALRPPGLYGVGERRHFPRAVSAMEAGQLLFTIGGLEALVEFVHVDNIVNAHILAGDALTQQKKQRSAGEVYFITDGDPVNNWEFFRPLIEGLGYTFPRINLPFVLVFLIVLVLEWVHFLIKPVYHFQPFLTRTELYQISVAHYFNIDKACNHLGYKPMKRDIKDIVQYYVRHGHRRKESKLWRFMVNVLIGAAFACIIMSFLPIAI